MCSLYRRKALCHVIVHVQLHRRFAEIGGQLLIEDQLTRAGNSRVPVQRWGLGGNHGARGDVVSDRGGYTAPDRAAALGARAAASAGSFFG